MAIGKQLPDIFKAYCKECGWYNILYKKDLLQGSIVECPECKEYVSMASDGYIRPH